MTAGVDVSLVVRDVSADALQRLASELRDAGLDSGWVILDDVRNDDLTSFDIAANGLPLSPVQVALPPVSEVGGLSRAEQVVAAARCRVQRLCPVAHGYPLAGWVLSPLPELCVREHMALLLDFGDESIPWADVVAFAREFPALPLVVLGGLREGDRAVAAALDATANVVIELSRATAPAVLGDLVERFGAHRFVWGSGGSPEIQRRRVELVHGLSADDRAVVMNDNAIILGNGLYAARYL